MGDSGTASDLQYPCGQRVTGLHLSHFQPPATVTGLQFLDVEDSVASGCGVWWLTLQDIVFWLLLVEMFSMCFPVFTELRARNVARGKGAGLTGPGHQCLAQVAGPI